MRRHIFKIIGLATLICLVGQFSLAQVSLVQAADIKARMKARLPEINQLKAHGKIGENKNGLLVFRTSDKSKSALITAENADRTKIYQAIAKREKTTPQLVGQRRALQISKHAKAGTWLQKPDGSWYKK